MLQCNISHSRDYRHPDTADVMLLLRLYLPYGSRERMGILQGTVYRQLDPSVWHDSGMAQEGQDRWDSPIPSCGRNGKTGRTVEFLYVCTAGAFWLPHFLQKSRVMVDGFLPLPRIREPWPLLKERILLMMFSQKKVLSPLSSCLPIKAEIMLCLTELRVFLCLQWKDKYCAVSSLNSRLVILRAGPIFSWTAAGLFRGMTAHLNSLLLYIS